MRFLVPLSLALCLVVAACSRPPGSATGTASEVASGGERRADQGERERSRPLVVGWPVDSDLPGADAARARLPLDRRPTKGAAEPLVTVVVFSDYECPHCARLLPTLDRLLELYGDETRIVYRDYPLSNHPHARDAALAARAVHRALGDEAFGRMHDLLFENQTALSRADLERYAESVGLEPAILRAAYDDASLDEAIDEDMELARRARITGTPTLFVDGRMIAGVPTFLELEELVDEEMGLAREAMRRGVPRAGLYDAVLVAASDPEEAARRRAETRVAAQDAPPSDEGRVFSIAIPETAPSRGPDDAKVTIQVWSDFECPYCGRVEPSLDRLRESYPSTVRVVFRHYPLSFHRHAREASLAAIAVAEQAGADGFWAFHDTLFAHQDALTPEDLERYALEVPGVTARRFRHALASRETAELLQHDVDALEELGVSIGTPMIFVNGRLIRGARPYEELAAAVDAALASATAR